MPIVKYDEKSLVNRYEILSRKKQYRDRLSILKDHKEEIFWKTLKEQLKLIINGSGLKIENELSHDSIDPLAELANCKYHQGARQVADEIINSVDNSEKILDKVMDDIAKIELDIKNIKENGNDQDTGID